MDPGPTRNRLPQPIRQSRRSRRIRTLHHPPLKLPLVVTSEDEVEHGSNLDLLEYANKCNVEESTLELNAERNLDDYEGFLDVPESGLSVDADDFEKKRYKRYRQWLRGKSLFKQRVDL